MRMTYTTPRGAAKSVPTATARGGGRRVVVVAAARAPAAAAAKQASSPAQRRGRRGGAVAVHASAAAEQQQQQQQQQAAADQRAATLRKYGPNAGLRRTTHTGGVKTATEHLHLPAPAVAVRNLVEACSFVQLCTIMSNMHHRRHKYPFGTLVDFASDGAGMPIFCLSPTDLHARNLAEDPHCSLVVQMPGWTGLANARVTIFGDVYRLPRDMQEAAREVYLSKHQDERRDRWVLSSYSFFRMHTIKDVYFVGGFGTVCWMDVAEYLAAAPDPIVTKGLQQTLAALNAEFAPRLPAALDPSSPPDEALIISVDALGADVRLRRGADLHVERVGFGGARADSLDEARAAMRGALARNGADPGRAAAR